MPERFVPKLLESDQIDQAYALVRAALPALNLVAWRRYASDLIAGVAPPSGIMTVQHCDYIHGLFGYRVLPHLTDARLLSVENFLAAQMFGTHHAETALAEALDDLAMALNCSAIRTILAAGAGCQDCSPVEPLHRMGHRTEATCLYKPLLYAVRG